MFRRALYLAACLAVAACAAKQRVPVAAAPPAPDPAVADRLVNEGCYRCLQEAFSIYEAAARREQAFSTALLLAMREKEIGLEASGWIDKVKTLAPAESTPYIDIVTALPWTAVAAAPDFEPPRRTPAGTIQEWLAFLKSPGATLLDAYATLALSCAGRGANTGADTQAITPDQPILQYRLGLCGPRQRPQLDAALAASPRFVEAGFFIARYEVVNGTGGPRITRALPLLIAAHEGLPEVPLFTVTLGGLWRVRNELARALALYDEALMPRPDQRDALLGRATVLSYFGRSEEAIATATRMITLGTWYLGDAYYWRAWNLYNTGKLEEAAADVVSARSFQNSGELLTLSGMIAYDQQRRGDARSDFEAARALNSANCPARWYLGAIDVDEQMWPPARDMFRTATDCYGEAAAQARADLEQLPVGLSPEAREQQQQDYTRRIADNARQQARSALNTALLSMQLGDKEEADRYARIALDHDLTRERAQEVLDRLTASTGSSTPPRATDRSTSSPATGATPASRP
jgi:tetratricopeptide (TPR) repeat protein